MYVECGGRFLHQGTDKNRRLETLMFCNAATEHLAPMLKLQKRNHVCPAALSSAINGQQAEAGRQAQRVWGLGDRLVAWRAPELSPSGSAASSEEA